MNCCVNCFADDQIREIISGFGIVDDCDYCGSRGVNICPPNENTKIAELIESVLDVYVVAAMPADGKPLKNALQEDWCIFARSADDIQLLITGICSDRYAKDARLFTEPVCIPECWDTDYLTEYGITRGRSWSEFAETIKYENRFYSNVFNQDAFASFLSFASKIYPTGTRMFRARICGDRRGFGMGEMSIPPKGKRNAGRINPEGVGVLYLASKENTALYEVRASMYDFITIGEFQLRQDIKIVNLAGIGSVSPFIYAYTNDLQRYAVNQKCLQEFAREISKPLRRNDSPLEYLPTQYISEYIKSQRYAGVEYASTMTSDGYNLAVFDETQFECIATRVYEITELSYTPRLV